MSHSDSLEKAAQSLSASAANKVNTIASQLRIFRTQSVSVASDLKRCVSGDHDQYLAVMNLHKVLIITTAPRQLFAGRLGEVEVEGKFGTGKR